jgi:hypothetical protein
MFSHNSSVLPSLPKYAWMKVRAEKIQMRIPAKKGIKPEPGMLAVPRSNCGA